MELERTDTSVVTAAHTRPSRFRDENRLHAAVAVRHVALGALAAAVVAARLVPMLSSAVAAALAYHDRAGSRRFTGRASSPAFGLQSVCSQPVTDGRDTPIDGLRDLRQRTPSLHKWLEPIARETATRREVLCVDSSEAVTLHPIPHRPGRPSNAPSDLLERQALTEQCL